MKLYYFCLPIKLSTLGKNIGCKVLSELEPQVSIAKMPTFSFDCHILYRMLAISVQRIGFLELLFLLDVQNNRFTRKQLESLKTQFI